MGVARYAVSGTLLARRSYGRSPVMVEDRYPLWNAVSGTLLARRSYGRSPVMVEDRLWRSLYTMRDPLWNAVSGTLLAWSTLLAAKNGTQRKTEDTGRNSGSAN